MGWGEASAPPAPGSNTNGLNKHTNMFKQFQGIGTL